MVYGPLENVEDNAPFPGVILVGGASRRFGHDKAMARLGGTTMVQLVAARVAGQVCMLAASGAGRPGLILHVIPDAIPLGGPLPALLSVLKWADERGFDMVATFSCDTPFLPSNLVIRLRRALMNDSDCSVALHSGATHPTCAVWMTAALPKVQATLEAGVRSLHGALANLKACYANFSDLSDGPRGDPFFNINSQSDMAEARAWLDRMPSANNDSGADLVTYS